MTRFLKKQSSKTETLLVTTGSINIMSSDIPIQGIHCPCTAV